jgi:hypothetical protein
MTAVTWLEPRRHDSMVQRTDQNNQEAKQVSRTRHLRDS